MYTHLNPQYDHNILHLARPAFRAGTKSQYFGRAARLVHALCNASRAGNARRRVVPRSEEKAYQHAVPEMIMSEIYTLNENWGRTARGSLNNLTRSHSSSESLKLSIFSRLARSFSSLPIS
jgi:hypothetical protein